MTDHTTLTILDLYPELMDPELAEAEANLDRYVELVLRIFERMEAQINAPVDQLTQGAGTLSCNQPTS
jgi:hypothetical protein